MRKLEDKLHTASKVIKFLNSKCWDALNALVVGDRIEIVIDSKKVISKKSLVQQTQKKYDEISNSHEIF